MSPVHFKAKSDVVDTDIGEDRVLLDLEKNTYFTLNPTAAEVWQAVNEPSSLEALVAVVTEKFDVTADLCRPDVERLLKELLDAELVTEVDA
ncbi:PqqD family protein [Roseobacter sp.]|uniref:PqqD family protein n=1 Tax=Roseobacter sp. TaxID=1907202 RepID=UPI00385ABB56